MQVQFEDERAEAQSVVWSSKLVVRPEHDIQQHLPDTLHVEATGLGGGISRMQNNLGVTLRHMRSQVSTCVLFA